MSTRVLIIGASGHIGFGVARAFRRAGHIVYGLVRSEAKAHRLAREEIIPVIGDAEKPDTWLAIAKKVSVIVDAAASYQNAKKFSTDVFSTAVEAAKGRHTPITFIYTSGVWVHGSSTEVKDESDLLVNAPAMVAWRPEFERHVLSHNKETHNLRTVVLRPGAVYGYGGSLTHSWFDTASKGAELVIPGTAGTKWSLVHVDDLADAYVRAAHRAELVHGQVFLLANPQSESLGDMFHALTRVTKHKAHVKYVKPSDPFTECLALNIVVSSHKARVLLGWEPKHLGFADGIESFHEVWKAHQKQ